MKSQELWYDIDKNKYYILKNGLKTRCNIIGENISYFIPYCTGCIDYKNRLNKSIEEKKSFFIPKTSIRLQTLFKRKLNDIIKTKGKNIKPLAIEQHSLNFNRAKTSQRLKRKLFTPTHTQNKPSYRTFITMQNSSCLPIKRTLYGSSIKRDYLNSLKKTFNDNEFKSMNWGNSIRNEHTVRSFTEVQKTIRKERAELSGFTPKEDKHINITFKGMYQIHVPKENELYEKAKTRCIKINPKAAITASKIEELDYKLLKKKRERKIMKDEYMKKHTRLILKKFNKEIMCKSSLN